MKTLLLLLSSALPAACALGPDFCASCHEIRPLIDNWKTSTHRGIECTKCHEYTIGRNVQRLTEHVKGEVPEQPKIGSPNSRLRSACTGRKPTARSSGYTECILRLRTDFCARTTAVVECLNAGRARTARVELP